MLNLDNARGDFFQSRDIFPGDEVYMRGAFLKVELNRIIDEYDTPHPSVATPQSF